MFEKLHKAVRNIHTNLPKVANIAIQNNARFIIEKNEEQLDMGILSTGKPIIPEYSASYKQSEKKPNWNPNLKKTGSFRDKFHLNIKSDGIFISSLDSKTGKLKEKYSGDIFGLTVSNSDEVFRDGILPDIRAFIIDELQVL